MPRKYEGFLFYGHPDLSGVNKSERCKKIFEDVENWETYSNANQIIELYNLNKLINLGQKPVLWTDELYALNKERSKRICGIICKFFSGLTLEQLKAVYNEIDVLYIADFWDIFCKTKIYLKYSEDEFQEFLFASKVNLGLLLKKKYLIEKFGIAVRNYIMSNPMHAETLVTEFLQKHQEDWGPLYFPKELSTENKQELIKAYIDSPDPNPNYLSLIAQEDNPNELKLDSKTKFDAYKKKKELTQAFFKERKGVVTTLSVEFCPMGGEGNTIYRQEAPSNMIFQYDQDWIDQNLDYPTLLNNFYWFDFVDNRGRCNFVWRRAQASLVESLMNTKGRKEYPSDIGFRAANYLALLQMSSYYNFLHSRGIEIENIFKWFFEVYLLKEFGAEGFVYDASSPNTTTGERNKLIATQIDHVLKQFDLFCTYGIIDREYLEFTSQHTIFKDVPSMIPCKYAYSDSTFLNQEAEYLFSRASYLIYIDSTDEIVESFYDLLMVRNLNISEFNEIQRGQLDFLVDRGLIKITTEGYLRLDQNRAAILRQIYEKEYLCLSYEKTDDDPLKSMLDNNELKVESSLFSRPEQKYLNYILNKSEFSNGLDLRNKYIHSTHSLDEHAQFEDYMRFLMVMAIIIIKINEEFCLRGSNHNTCLFEAEAQ